MDSCFERRPHGVPGPHDGLGGLDYRRRIRSANRSFHTPSARPNVSRCSRDRNRRRLGRAILDRLQGGRHSRGYAGTARLIAGTLEVLQDFASCWPSDGKPRDTRTTLVNGTFIRPTSSFQARLTFLRWQNRARRRVLVPGASSPDHGLWHRKQHAPYARVRLSERRDAHRALARGPSTLLSLRLGNLHVVA